jgi:hypothetical protein
MAHGTHSFSHFEALTSFVAKTGLAEWWSTQFLLVSITAPIPPNCPAENRRLLSCHSRNRIRREAHSYSGRDVRLFSAASNTRRPARRDFFEADGSNLVSRPRRTGSLRIAHKICSCHLPRRISVTCETFRMYAAQSLNIVAIHLRDGSTNLGNKWCRHRLPCERSTSSRYADQRPSRDIDDPTEWLPPFL